MPSDEAVKAATDHLIFEESCADIDERLAIRWAEVIDRMMAQARAEFTQIVIDEITSSTGPTGGWLDSPKAITAAIRERLAGRGK